MAARGPEIPLCVLKFVLFSCRCACFRSGGHAEAIRVRLKARNRADRCEGKGLILQSVERADLNSAQSGFESQWAYHPLYFRLLPYLETPLHVERWFSLWPWPSTASLTRIIIAELLRPQPLLPRPLLPQPVASMIWQGFLVPLHAFGWPVAACFGARVSPSRRRGAGLRSVTFSQAVLRLPSSVRPMAMEAYLSRPRPRSFPPACSWRACCHDDVQPPALAPETCCPASYFFLGYSANRSLCWRRPPVPRRHHRVRGRHGPTR